MRNIEETEAAKKLLQEKRLTGRAKSDFSIPSSYTADYFQRGRDYAEKLRRGLFPFLFVFPTFPHFMLFIIMTKIAFFDAQLISVPSYMRARFAIVLMLVVGGRREVKAVTFCLMPGVGTLYLFRMIFMKSH